MLIRLAAVLVGLLIRPAVWENRGQMRGRAVHCRLPTAFANWNAMDIDLELYRHEVRVSVRRWCGSAIDIRPTIRIHDGIFARLRRASVSGHQLRKFGSANRVIALDLWRTASRINRRAVTAMAGSIRSRKALWRRGQDRLIGHSFAVAARRRRPPRSGQALDPLATSGEYKSTVLPFPHRFPRRSASSRRSPGNGWARRRTF